MINLKIIKDAGFAGKAAPADAGPTGPSRGKGKGGGVGGGKKGSASTLTSGLVAYWDLDEASGNRADDGGGVYTLTDNNTVTSTAGLGDTVANFTAANGESLSTTTLTDIHGGDKNFSIVAWANLATNSSVMGVVGLTASASVLDYALLYNNGYLTGRYQFYVNWGTSNYFATATTLGKPSTSTWYMLYAEYDYDNNIIRMSANAGPKDDGQQPANHPLNTSGTVFAIGQQPFSSGGRYFNGQIGRVGYWNRILTADELTSLYNGGTGLKYASL